MKLHNTLQDTYAAVDTTIDPDKKQLAKQRMLQAAVAAEPVKTKRRWRIALPATAGMALVAVAIAVVTTTTPQYSAMASALLETLELHTDTFQYREFERTERTSPTDSGVETQRAQLWSFEDNAQLTVHLDEHTATPAFFSYMVSINEQIDCGYLSLEDRTDCAPYVPSQLASDEAVLDSVSRALASVGQEIPAITKTVDVEPTIVEEEEVYIEWYTDDAVDTVRAVYDSGDDITMGYVATRLPEANPTAYLLNVYDESTQLYRQRVPLNMSVTTTRATLRMDSIKTPQYVLNLDAGTIATASQVAVQEDHQSAFFTPSTTLEEFYYDLFKRPLQAVYETDVLDEPVAEPVITEVAGSAVETMQFAVPADSLSGQLHPEWMTYADDNGQFMMELSRAIDSGHIIQYRLLDSRGVSIEEVKLVQSNEVGDDATAFFTEKEWVLRITQ